jgi:protein-tyrosine phosphatase
MIDIHCHILPAIDDGVQTLEEAVSLIGIEASGGTKAFIATPHIIEKRDYDRLLELPDRIATVKSALRESGIDVEIFPGGEIYPTLNMVQAIDKGQSVTLAGKGKHMLVDLPMGSLPNDLESLLYELQVRGVTPILAHPERVAPFQNDPDSLRPFLDRGVACQVNAASLAGKYGPRAAEVARLILKRRWAHFLSSDAHRPPRRPILGTCRTLLAAELDSAYLDLLTVGSASAVLAGTPLPELPPMPPEEAPKKGWFAKLLSRKP